MNQVPLFKGDITVAELVELDHKFEVFITDFKLLIGNKATLHTTYTVQFDNTRQNREVCKKYKKQKQNFDYIEESGKLECIFKWTGICLEQTENIRVFEDGDCY